MDKDVEIRIGANAGPLEEGLAAAKAAIAEFAEQSQAAFESVTTAFETINVAVAAFTAALAGGEAFKEVVSSSIDAAVSAQQLGRALGITTTQASVLRVAMDQQHVPMEAVAAAANKIATAIRKNPEEFQRLGVALRDSNGNLRNSFDIMQDVNSKLSELKEGTDRNVEGQRIYGKSWAEVAPSIRLTKAAMEEALAEALELHLIVGQEGVARSEAYRKAMAGVHAELEGVSRSIGDALVPFLTRLAEGFKEAGNAVTAVRGSIAGLVAIFERISAVNDIVLILEHSWVLLGNIVVGAANAIEHAMHMDFAGARAAWDKGLDNLAQDTLRTVALIKGTWNQATQAIDEVSTKMASTETPTAEKTGAAANPEDAKKPTSRVGDWQTVLEEKKVAFQEEAAAEGQIREYSKAQEIAYWQSILATTTTSLEERKQIRAKIAGDELAIDKARLEGSLATLKNEEAAAGQDLQAKLAAEQRYADQVKQIYGAESKEFAESQKSIVTTTQAINKERLDLEEIYARTLKQSTMGQIDAEESMAQQRYDLGQISMRRLLELQRQYEDEKFALAQDELFREMALADANGTLKDQAVLNQQLVQLQTQHNAQLLQLDNKMAQQEGALWKNLSTTIQQNMANAFTGVIERTETVHQAFNKMLTGILGTVIETTAKMIAKFVEQAAVNLALNKQQT